MDYILAPSRASHRLVLTGLLATACFLNTLRGGFVFDDHRGIETNNDIRTETPLSSLWMDDFWGGSMAREQSHKSYRPLTVLSYRWMNYLFFGMEPWAFHLGNCLLHAAATVFFLLLLEDFQIELRIKMAAALLFAVHSVHTEAVANTVGRAEMLSAVFYFSAIMTYRRSFAQWEKRGTAWHWLGVSLLLAACAMLSKEQGVSCLGIFIIVDLAQNWLQWWERGCIPRVGTVLLGGTCMLYARLSMNYGSEPIFKPHEMRAAFHPELVTRLLSFQYIYAWNAALLLWPSPLCCDWSLGSVPLVNSFTDLRNLASVGLYATLLLLSLKAGRDLWKDRWLLTFALAMIVVPFLPASGAVFRVGFVVAERVLYLPSAGFCLAVAVGYCKLRVRSRFTSEVGFLLVLMFLCVKTVLRNEDWNTDLQLYKSGVQVNPGNVKLHNNYGMMLVEEGRHAEALAAYTKALELEPEYHDVHFNLGNLHHAAGHLAEAQASFAFAAKNPNQARRALNNLGSVLMKQGKLQEAEAALKESIAAPAPDTQDNAQAYNNLGGVLGEQKRFAEAESAFRSALKVRPGYVEAHFNLGTLLVHANRLDDAEEELHHALQLDPNHAGAINNLKVVHWRRDHPGQM